MQLSIQCNSQVSLSHAVFPCCELQAHRGKAAHAVDLCSGVSRFLGTGGLVIQGGMLNYGFSSSICTYLVTLSSWC